MEIDLNTFDYIQKEKGGSGGIRMGVGFNGRCGVCGGDQFGSGRCGFGGEHDCDGFCHCGSWVW